MGSKADILARLRQDILSLQGSKPPLYSSDLDIRLGPITSAFPNATFPTSAVHEFVHADKGSFAATTGFISGVLSLLMKKNSKCIWITKNRLIYPPALKTYGIHPENIIFIEAKNERDLLWILEESLRCDPLTAVICEVKEISFVASRRLQLAVEESHVTGMIIRSGPRNLATASDARWKITSVAGDQESELPGLGYPKWNIELLKVRNGKTGCWQSTWRNGRFHFDQPVIRLQPFQKKKTG